MGSQGAARLTSSWDKTHLCSRKEAGKRAGQVGAGRGPGSGRRELTRERKLVEVARGGLRAIKCLQCGGCGGGGDGIIYRVHTSENVTCMGWV